MLDSDSDSDLELLEELDFGLSKKEPQKDPKKKEQEESLAARKSREVPGPRSYIRSKDDGLRKPPKSVPTSNNGAFRNLVQSLQKDNEVELKLAEWKALLEEKLEEESDSSDKAASTIDESLLAGVVNDDAGEEKAKRLYLAMQRTNALESDCVFHFFGDAPKCGSTRRTTFPSHILPRQGWTSCFDGKMSRSISARVIANKFHIDEWSRDQSFLSGFAQQIFEYQSLPEELAQWVIDQGELEYRALV